jgi:biotin-[acetyl-CoA-carboxylase] ligase BirA-like protein
MLARALAVELHELHRNDDVAAALDARENFAGKPAGNGVGFTQNKGSLNCHNGRWLRAAGKRGLHRESARMLRFSRLVRVAETGSTNDDVARILGEPQARGLVLTADYQRSGAGRRGRSWVAPAGSALLCTIAPPDPLPSSDLWMVPFWAALVTKDALASLGAACMLQWPNDVLIGAHKVAGILCISRVNGESAWVGCGIGINVVRPQDESAFAGLESPPAFVEDAANANVDRMLDALIASAESAYPLLRDPQSVARAWEHAAELPRPYRVLRDNEAAPFECTALRLSSDGSLVVEREGREELVTLADARVLR